jgi:ankyrin repeat protein
MISHCTKPHNAPLAVHYATLAVHYATLAVHYATLTVHYTSITAYYHTQSGWTALMVAAVSGHDPVVTILLAKGAETHHVNKVSRISSSHI